MGPIKLDGVSRRAVNTVIQLDIDFEFSELSAVLAALMAQSPEFRPTKISLDEASKRQSISSDELNDVRSLKFQYPGGFELYGASAEYHFSLRENEECDLFGLFADANAARVLVRELAKLDVAYGFACESAERKHRNRIVSQDSYGTIEAWVGRDYSKWLPGVYWMNIIPTSMLHQHGLRAESLDDISTSVDFIGEKNFLVELYEKPSAWRENAERIDQWCETQPGVFFRRQAQIDLEMAANLQDSMEALRRWK